ncbi:MAG: glycosyltransferase family 2 protein [Pirellulaceae bacterium]
MSENLTVLIPCRNEQNNIRECIESARLIADEILIADSLSDDHTLEIVRAVGGCRIIQREFVDMGNFKNWAIPQAAHAWVFVLDADERVTPELATEINTLKQSGLRKKAYWVYRRNHFMGHPVRFGGWAADKVIRLFRRDDCRYLEYTDHTEVDIAKSETGTLRQKMVHFTCWDFEQYLRKTQRYTDQQAELWFQNQKPFRFFKLATVGPARFARDYLLRLGFLDGAVGFQLAALTGFYSFLKQAKLWHKYYAANPPRDADWTDTPDRRAA